MRRLALAILTVILGSFQWVDAAIEPDSLIREVERYATAIEGMSIDSCSDTAIQWVENIAPDDLLAYTAYAERVMYTPYCSQQARIVYRTLLDRLLQSGIDELQILRYRHQYNQLTHNNEGETAVDFIYYDINDNEYRLSQNIGYKTLVIFNNPGCEDCATLHRHIILYNELDGETIDSTTTVMVIYPDIPTDEWRNSISHYPKHWIIGYSEDVIDLYDLRTLPATYLLDPQHTITKRNKHTYITHEP